jgi:hypothetical protein
MKKTVEHRNKEYKTIINTIRLKRKEVFNLFLTDKISVDAYNALRLVIEQKRVLPKHKDILKKAGFQFFDSCNFYDASGTHDIVLFNNHLRFYVCKRGDLYDRYKTHNQYYSYYYNKRKHRRKNENK